MPLNLLSQNLISLLGIESLADDKKQELLNQASALIEKRLLLRLLDQLPEDKRNRMLKHIEQNDQAGLTLFLAQDVPEFQDWVGQEVAKVKTELHELSGQA